MARMFLGLLAGLLFGVGLTVSHMVNPAKVLAFLDVAAVVSGEWDPSLALVMLAAVATAAPGFYFAKRRPAPLLDDVFAIPERREPDARLVGGALLFGIGWGLVGYCPGPAITGLAYGLAPTFGFVAAMLVGMLGFRLATRRRTPGAAFVH